MPMPGEMLRPTLQSWVKEYGEFPVYWIGCLSPPSLELVATITGEAEIVGVEEPPRTSGMIGSMTIGIPTIIGLQQYAQRCVSRSAICRRTAAEMRRRLGMDYVSLGMVCPCHFKSARA